MPFVTESASVENTAAPTATISNFSVSENTRSADGSSTSSGKTAERTISIGRKPPKASYSEAAKKLIPSDTNTSSEAKPAETAPAAEAKQEGEAKPATTEKPAETAAATPDPVAEYRKANDRLTSTNAKLLREVEELRASKPKRDMSDREKAFDEIDRGYFDSPATSVRKLLAQVIGDKDHQSERVTSELRNLYLDLTEHELGVAPSESAKATRESQRTRAIVEREKRDRAAAEEAAAKQPAAAPDEDKETAGKVARVGSLLPAIAEKHPLAMSLSEHFDDEKPEALIYKIIAAGFKTGEFDPATNDDVLVAAAAEKIENHYRGLVEKIDAARNKTATPPTQESTPQDSPSAGADRSPVVRTITGAHASVAPATPPAAKTDDKPPVQYVSKRQKHLALAEKYASAGRRG